MNRLGKIFLPASLFIFFFFCACSPDPGNYLDKKQKKEKISSFVLTKKKHKAFDFKELEKNKASVFIFLSPDCPLCQGYAPVIRKLQDSFASDSIYVYAVFPGELYSDEEISKFLNDYELNLPYFIDDNFVLTDFMKASVTPEAFIVNKEGRIIYSGRIDNWAYETGKKRAEATEHDLENALNEVRAGKEIKVKNTEAIGCIIEKKK